MKKLLLLGIMSFGGVVLMQNISIASYIGHNEFVIMSNQEMLETIGGTIHCELGEYCCGWSHDTSCGPYGGWYCCCQYINGLFKVYNIMDICTIYGQTACQGQYDRVCNLLYGCVHFPHCYLCGDESYVMGYWCVY